MKNFENIKEEVRKDFQESTTGIGIFIILTKFIKNLHTKTAIIIVSGLASYSVALLFYFYLNLSISDIFIMAGPGHIVGYMIGSRVIDIENSYEYFRKYQETLEDIRDGKLN